MERYSFNSEYSISRIIKGGWHLAGGHGNIDPEKAIEDMHAFVQAGITTFDCADIYTGVEELIGAFKKKHKAAFQSKELPSIQIHTKYVPDYDKLWKLKKEDTEAIIDRSLLRLGVERLDLVQFAWWTYEAPGYVETALHLKALQKAGKIRYIGLTNFDGKRVQEILDAGVSVLSNQLQYSVFDHRPEWDMEAIRKSHNIPYLCYGSLAGGFLSDRYLGAPDPKGPMENRSLTKYRLIIEEFGSYEYFQQTLKCLREIADKYEVDIAAVAGKYILQKEGVAALIVGARNRNHLHKYEQFSGFELDRTDLAKIEKMVQASQGPKGPVYELERDKEGKHGRIMKYNLNEE
ncbi:MAG: aldo/keto reductase [Bacteroidia bacterium]|nr:aldo/keto reductase [Bacteroidia bacterium]